MKPMMKPHWLRRLGSLAAAIVVCGLAVGAYVWDHREPTGAAPSVDVLSYWVEDPAWEPAVRQALAATNLTATPADRGQADVVVSRQPGDAGVPAFAAGPGQPQPLTSGVVVAPKSSTKAYAHLAPTARNSARAQKALAALTAGGNEPSWTLLAAGDIGLGRSIYTTMRARQSYSYPFEAMADEIQSADLAIANLECALSDERAVVSTSGMTFVAPFAAAAGLKAAGFDALSVANNHSYNGGAAGFLDTLAELDRRGIASFGGGATAQAARAPRILTVKGVKVALLGYSAVTGSPAATPSTPGMNYLSLAPWGEFDDAQVKAMEADIRAAHQQADVVVPFYHWGTEYTHAANADQRRVAQRAIDAGADVVLGAHPHWVQGIEWYNGHLISYSLGNFVFDQAWSLKTTQGYTLKLTFAGTKLTRAELMPYAIVSNIQPKPATDSPAKQILSDVFDHSWWPEPAR